VAPRSRKTKKQDQQPDLFANETTEAVTPLVEATSPQEIAPKPKPKNTAAQVKPESTNDAVAVQEPPPEPRAKSQPLILSVGDLARGIESLLRDTLTSVWVRGEVANLRRSPQGHCYFTLRDAEATVKAVLFRGMGGPGSAILADGEEVVVHGAVTFYGRGGDLQIKVLSIVAGGRGALHIKLEALRKKLAAEGLIGRPVRPLPRFPQKVVLVTAPRSAAIRDMLRILDERAPQLELFVYAVPVQGENAYLSIAAALGHLSRWHETDQFRPDVVILARGGGSLEDLWSFNEEAVARAIAACPFPVVTGIGHEVDTTLADNVADLRCPTPTAAAQAIIEDRADLIAHLQQLHCRADNGATRSLAHRKKHLELIASRPVLHEPSALLDALRQRLDMAVLRGSDQAGDRIERHQDRVRRLGTRLAGLSPQARLQTWRGRCDVLRARMSALPDKMFQTKLRALQGLERHFDPQRILATLAPLRIRWERATARLETHDQRKVLARGYAMVWNSERTALLRSVRDLPEKTPFLLELADGQIAARAEAPASSDVSEAHTFKSSGQTSKHSS
jgi:exodeoxyribonuclease VII large subunit